MLYNTSLQPIYFIHRVFRPLFCPSPFPLPPAATSSFPVSVRFCCCCYSRRVPAKSYSQSCPTLCDPTDCTCQGPLSVGFSGQEYWRGLLCPPPGDLSDPGMELCLLCLLHWQAGPLPCVLPGKPVIVTTLFYFLDSADVISYNICVSLPYLVERNKDLACSPWALFQSHLRFPFFSAPWLILVGPCGISPSILILRCSYPTLLL